MDVDDKVDDGDARRAIQALQRARGLPTPHIYGASLFCRILGGTGTIPRATFSVANQLTAA